jgi:hypothetical protein
MADITTIAELGTAGGTLILALATFASVRSANRAARVAERSLELGLRPLLVQSRPEDPPEPAMFGSGRMLMPGNGLASIERHGGSVFLLHGDHEGGQRTISRFGLRPHHQEEGRWFCSVSRHWTLEGPDPRGDVH